MGLYENIKAISEKKGISINKLEKTLNLPRSSVMKYNTSVPSVEKVRLIANYLGVTVDAIINTEDLSDGHPEWYLDSDAAREAQEMFEDDDMRALFHMKRNMNPEKFKAHMDMMKQLYRLEHPEDHPEDYE